MEILIIVGVSLVKFQDRFIVFIKIIPYELTQFFFLHVFPFLVQVYAYDASKNEKRENLGFRPVHFAAVGLPLGDTPTGNGGAPKTGAFKIEDGNVVGMYAVQ